MKSTAAELFDKGVKAMTDSKWEECRAALLAAWSIHRSYQIAGNLAECETKQARYADAAGHLTFFLREMPADAPAERKARGEELLREVRPKVAELTVRVSKPDAEVLVDGKAVGRAPLSEALFVEPGDHKVEARLGGSTTQASVTAKGGGTHAVVLKLEETRPAEGERPRKELWISGVSVAGAGVIAGAILLGVAEAKKSEAVTLRDELLQSGGSKACQQVATNPKCGALQSALDTRYTLGNAAGWAFVGAGVLTAVTVAYVVITRKSTPAPVQAVVFVGPQGGGAVLGASF